MKYSFFKERYLIVRWYECELVWEIFVRALKNSLGLASSSPNSLAYGVLIKMYYKLPTSRCLVEMVKVIDLYETVIQEFACDISTDIHTRKFLKGNHAITSRSYP